MLRAASLILIAGLPALASSIVMVSCTADGQTVTQSGATDASCNLTVELSGAAASGTISPGNAQGIGAGFSLAAAGGGLPVGSGIADSQASFDLIFTEPAIITWDLSLGGESGGVSMQLGPVSLSGQQILAIATQFPNGGRFVETVPAGDWTFSGHDHDSLGDGQVTLGATIQGIATPEPATWVIVGGALFLLLVWTTSWDINRPRETNP